MVDVRERRLRPVDLFDPHGSVTIHNLGSRLRLLAGCENYDPAALNSFDIGLGFRLDHPKGHQIVSQVHFKIRARSAQHSAASNLKRLADNANVLAKNAIALEIANHSIDQSRIFKQPDCGFCHSILPQTLDSSDASLDTVDNDSLRFLVKTKGCKSDPSCGLDEYSRLTLLYS
jgi:hypothetical protein